MKINYQYMGRLSFHHHRLCVVIVHITTITRRVPYNKCLLYLKIVARCLYFVLNMLDKDTYALQMQNKYLQHKVKTNNHFLKINKFVVWHFWGYCLGVHNYMEKSMRQNIAIGKKFPCWENNLI